MDNNLLNIHFHCWDLLAFPSALQVACCFSPSNFIPSWHLQKSLVHGFNIGIWKIDIYREEMQHSCQEIFSVRKLNFKSMDIKQSQIFKNCHRSFSNLKVITAFRLVLLASNHPFGKIPLFGQPQLISLHSGWDPDQARSASQVLQEKLIIAGCGECWLPRAITNQHVAIITLITHNRLVAHCCVLSLAWNFNVILALIMNFHFRW